MVHSHSNNHNHGGSNSAGRRHARSHGGFAAIFDALEDVPDAPFTVYFDDDSNLPAATAGGGMDFVDLTTANGETFTATFLDGLDEAVGVFRVADVSGISSSDPTVLLCLED